MNQKKFNKTMKFNWKLSKHKNLLLKVAAASLILGLAFRFFFFGSSQIKTPIADATVVEGPPSLPASVHVQYNGSILIPDNEDQIPQDIVAQCDLFTGNWVPNPSGPSYTNESCPLIEGHQNCMRNGRPDVDYLYWRWNPHECQLPPFDAGRFLELMRNKTWAFIGDSISRNHVQSFLCVLSVIEKGVEVYHDEEFKSRRWHFPSYNLTVSNIWSPFLVKAEIFEDINGVSTSEVQLYLDQLDSKWTDHFQSLDYTIISTGKWFLKAAIYHENDTEVGCHICPEGKNLTQLGFVYAYNKSLHYAMNHIAQSGHKGLIFFRTTTPDHFENGEWHNGGTCPRTKPAKEGEIEIKSLHRILRDIELEAVEKAAAEAARNGVQLKLLDFMNMLLSRPDGHPGPYREFHPFAKDKNAKVQNDCLHWCLPGPMDSWNDVIMEMVVNG